MKKKLVLKKKWQNLFESLGLIGIFAAACIESNSMIPYLLFASLTIPYLLFMKYMRYE